MREHCGQNILPHAAATPDDPAWRSSFQVLLRGQGAFGDGRLARLCLARLGKPVVSQSELIRAVVSEMYSKKSIVSPVQDSSQKPERKPLPPASDVNYFRTVTDNSVALVVGDSVRE